jgi:outer membrane protein assembly factor BamB
MRLTKSGVILAAAVAVLAGLAVLPGASASATGAPPSVWPQSRYGAARTGYNPDETQLNVRNVHTLVIRATIRLGMAYAAAAPVVADGLAFIPSYSLGATTGDLQVFLQSCATAKRQSCPPVWRATVGAAAETSVAVADGEVFVDTDGGVGNDTQRLWAFGEHCATGGAACSPRWTATIPGVSYENEAPTVAGGVVYIPVGNGIETSDLDAFPVKCSTPCHPLWRGKTVAGADDSAAAGDGFVYIPDYDGNMYAFKVGCASGGRVCSPAWFGSVNEGGPRGAALADGMAFIGSQNGDLYAFKARGCGTSLFPCAPVWTGVTRRGANILSPPAVADGLVFVTNYVDRHLYAFPEHCASECHYRWTARITPEDVSPPTVANGVVYVSVGSNEKNVGIDAFSVTCATGGRSCTPLWHKKLGFYIPSGPSIAGGMLWVADGPENGPADLYALGLPVPSGPATRRPAD